MTDETETENEIETEQLNDLTEWPDRQAACYALAKALAIIYGQLDSFLREEAMGDNFDTDDPDFTGHYLGFMADASIMIDVLQQHGIHIYQSLSDYPG